MVNFNLGCISFSLYLYFAAACTVHYRPFLGLEQYTLHVYHNVYHAHTYVSVSLMPLALVLTERGRGVVQNFWVKPRISPKVAPGAYHLLPMDHA